MTTKNGSPSQRRFEDAQWWARPAKRITVTLLFLLLCVLIGISAKIFSQQVKDEGKFNRSESLTCLIQGRAIGGQRYLTSAMIGIYKLLVLPRQPGQPPIAPSVSLILHNLEYNLSKYIIITNSQPLHRKCP